MKIIISYLLTVFLFIGCIANSSKLSISGKTKKEEAAEAISISSVQIINHQLVINGTGLKGVSKVLVNGNSLNETFDIESTAATKIIANSAHNFSFDISKVFNLIVSDANASATFQINFSLCNATIHGAGFDCSLTVHDNDVLTFDIGLNKWIPRALGGLNYQGVWNANTAQPTASIVGEYYIVSVPNSPTYAIGDWIVWNGTSYDHIVQSGSGGSVSTVFGRVGNILPVEGDYNLDKLLDVDLTVAPTSGQVLKYNGTKWIASNEAVTGGAGSVTTSEIADASVTDAKIVAVAASKITGTITSAQITDGTIVNADISATAAIDYSKLNIANGDIAATKVGSGAVDNTEFGYLDGVTSAIQTQLSAKEGSLSAGTASQYYKGTKVWATLDTNAVAEGTNLYFTVARAKSATVVDAIVDGVLDVSPSQNAVFDALTGKLSLTGGTLSIGTISGVPSPTTDDQVANKSYVDSSHSLGALVPANTVILMDACSSGWTDTGAMAVGPTGAYCTTSTSCRKCQSPATASLIPASKTLLMESCPAGWSNLGINIGPGSAAINNSLYQLCQSPAASTGLSLNAKVMMPACPSTWLEVGSAIASGGPQAADCGSGGCKACLVNGGIAARSLIGMNAISSIQPGADIQITAGAGGTTSGDGGLVNITAGSSVSAATATSGDVNITAGLNTGANNGDITLTAGSATVGTAGYILLNPYNTTTARVGIGTDVPGKMLSVNGAMEAQSVETPSLSAASTTTANLVVNGNINSSVVAQVRNASASGYSGIAMTDSGSTSQGFVGYANASAGNFPGAMVVSSLSGAPIIFGMSGFETMRVAPSGEITMGGSVPPVTYRMTVSGGSIDITSGGVRATAAYVQTSDIRLKTHIDYVNSQTALERITSLRGITYDWKDQEKMGYDRQLGLIAQDIKKVFPEAVKTDSEGFLSVGYGTLIAPVIEAIKELNKRVIALFNVTDKHSRAIASIKSEDAVKDQKIKKLEAENAEMKARLDKIEKVLNKSK